MDKSDLLDEQFLACRFHFSTLLKDKVIIKGIIEKHNKEIGWKFNEKGDRNEDGDKIITFEMTSSNENLNDLNEKIDLIAGLLQDIFRAGIYTLDEESAESFNQAFIGVVSGEELEKHPSINIKNLNKKAIYGLRQLYNNQLIIIGDLNKIIEIEKIYPKVVKKVFGVIFQEWYEEEVKKLKKTFVDKEVFEKSKAIVEAIEKSNINKISYKTNKFRLHFS